MAEQVPNECYDGSIPVSWRIATCEKRFIGGKFIESSGIGYIQLAGLISHVMLAKEHTLHAPD